MVFGMDIIIFYIIYFCNLLIPKNDAFILFFSIPDYTDNAYVVYDHIQKSGGRKKKIIWLIDDAQNVGYRNNGTLFVKRKSLKGLWYFFRSKYIFHTHGLFRNATTKSQVVISCWHGMPLKRIQYMFPEKDLNNIASRKFVFECTIATSTLMASVISKCFNCNINDVLVTGLPRNDLLFQKEKFLGVTEEDLVIIWMPTYRDGNNRKEGKQYPYGIPLLNEENIIELDNCCIRNNVKLFIKLHSLQENASKLPLLKNIRLIDNNIMNGDKHFYRYLGSSAALITDYSSVYIDYLSLDRPIGFILDDYNEYKDDRGFVFDKPLEYMPGSHIYSFEEFKTFIYEIANGIDTTKSIRDTIGMELNQFRDDKNTERFFRKIGFILSKKF